MNLDSNFKLPCKHPMVESDFGHLEIISTSKYHTHRDFSLQDDRCAGGRAERDRLTNKEKRKTEDTHQ